MDTPTSSANKRMPSTVLPEGWPRPKGYANGMLAEGRILVTGGVIGWDKQGVFAPDFAGQAAQVFANIRAILAAGGAASRPGGLWLGVPTPAATALAVAVTLALAAFDRARTGALCMGVLPLAGLLLIGAPVPGLRALSGPPLFALAAHTFGWPLPRGGSQSISDALAAYLQELGGKIQTGHPVTTLDEFFGTDTPVKLIKCDVEGHEYEVFKGGERLLRTHRPMVLFECEDRHHRQKDWRDTFAFLEGLGYQGAFFSRRGLRSLKEFDPVRHGVPESPEYANNFAFRFPGPPVRVR